VALTPILTAHWDDADSHTIEGYRRHGGYDMVPVTFGVHPEDYEALLGRHGFAVVDLALASELQARYAPQVRATLDDSMYVLTAERTTP